MASRRRSKNIDEGKAISPAVDAAVSGSDSNDRPARRRRTQGLGPSRRQRRLLFESLGQRRVLAVITGTVFHDLDGSMRPEASEVSLGSRLAFIDSNDNSTLDPGEPYAVTDSAGAFRFDDVPTGIHSVRLFNGSAAQRQTFPIDASQTDLPASFDSAIGSALAGEQLNVLTDSSLLQIETSATRASQFAFDFNATGLVASISNQPLGAGSASIIAGTFTEQDQGRSGLWLVPAGADRPQLVHYDANPNAFAAPVAAVGSDGAGVVIAAGGQDDTGGQEATTGTIHTVRIVRTAVGVPTLETINVQVASTGVPVPAGTQVLASDSSVQFPALLAEPVTASRSVFAWPLSTESAGESSPSEPALVATLWSNGQADWISGTETVISGATELLSFDDAAGLLAVRYAAGEIAILDVDAGFAELQQFQIGAGLSTLVPGKDAMVSIVAEGPGSPESDSESIVTLLLHDIRDGGLLASHSINIESIGTPTNIIPGGTLDSYYLLGNSGALSIELGQPAPHDVAIDDPQDTVSVDFGLQVDQEHHVPQVQDEFHAVGLEDKPLQIDASQIAALVADANHDRLVSLIVQEPDHGSVAITAEGGVSYQPTRDFNGVDSFAIRLHNGQAASEPIQFAVSVAPQPDLPTGIRFLGGAIPEHTEGPNDVGSIDVIDVDVGDQYELGVLDSRFKIEDGRLILLRGGLNYELEPEIQLVISGYDYQAGQYFSHQITVPVEDENDPITEMAADVHYVAENSSAVYVGLVIAIDEDEGQLISYSVDDDRFEMIGDQIWLKEGETLDYESESEVVLIVTANDQAGSTASVEVRVPVFDVPESISQITLSNETVMELEPGATVGDVQLDGVPAASSYRLSVDDPRFEIDGSELKLLDDQSVRRSAAEQIELTITAQDVSATFNAVSQTFVIEVLENDTPFHNEENPYDVDGNGSVSPLDALAIINYLNIYGPGPVGPGDPGFGYDVNGDGQVTTLDALLIINYLNQIQSGGIVGGEKPEGEEVSGQDRSDGETTAEAPAADQHSANDDQATSTLAGTAATTNVNSIAPINDIPINDAAADRDAIHVELSGSDSGSSVAAVSSSAAASELTTIQIQQVSQWLREIRDQDHDAELTKAIDERLVVLSQQ